MPNMPLRPSVPGRPSREERSTGAGLPVPWFLAGLIGVLLLIYYVWRAMH